MGTSGGRSIRGGMPDRTRLWAFLRDTRARARWGPTAPRFAERIWVRPSECERILYGIDRSRSGEVTLGDWDAQPSLALEDSPNVQACRRHWEDGLSWEETGIFDYLQKVIDAKGAADGCRTLEELVERHRMIDQLFDDLRRDGRVRTRAELADGSFRELGGVFVHIGRNLEPIFGGGGHHRLAASLVLGFPRIPAQIGVVHPDALPGWREKFTAAPSPPVSEERAEPPRGPG